MGKYCLIGKSAEEFKKKLNSGEINPEELSKMTSAERRKFFGSFLDEENSKNVNTLFERKLLGKRRWEAMIKWASEVSGIKPEVRRDLISKIEKMRTDKGGNMLSPKEEKAFLQDLASSKLGIGVTLDETKKLSELSELVEKAKIEAGDFKDYEKRIEYGNKILDLYDYANSLKPGQPTIEKIASVANVPRAIMSTLDLSAPFRQGFGAVSRKEFWRNLRPMVKSAFKESAYREIQADILTRPSYNSMQRSGLRITGLGDRLSNREEAFMTTLLDKVPGIRGSERAYTAFLAKTRADLYDNFIKKAEMLGENVQPGSRESKEIANMINNFTGAGKVGTAASDTSVPILNAMFFSPRKIAATFSILNPTKYLKVGEYGVKSKVARQEALKNLLGMIGVSTTMLGMAKLNGAKIEKDPRSSDFGKIVVGNTRFDVSGGNASYAVLLARLISGQTKSTTSEIVRTLGEDYGAPTRGDTLVKFFRNKLSPTASFIGDWLYGADAVGNPFNLKEETINRIKPLSVSSIIETALNDPTMAVPVGLAEIVGIGTQTYDTTMDWNQNPGKELSQFKEKVGQDKFDSANKSYNEELARKTKALLNDERYINLSDEDKQKTITKMKKNIKDKIFKENKFK